MSQTQRKAATADSVSFEFGDFSYSIPSSENWPIEVVEFAEDGAMTKALRALLGPDQWTEFRKRHSTVGELRDFFERAGEAVGAGN